jgi:hypothetical protein
VSQPFDPAKAAKAAAFLIAHPEFEEMPATIEEFLGPEYLNIADIVRDGVKKALIDIFGEEVNADRISNYEQAMFTGAIGIGKTTFASIAIPYMVHHTLCLRDPQKFYKLMPGSRIAFMQMSTSANNALNVVFGDIKARIENAPWFIDNYPHDKSFKKQIRFPKNVWILPGGSEETQFEGYNILGGILDEMDSHKIVDEHDYAEQGFNTIENRITSRFKDFSNPEESHHFGLIICIGQMKSASGFAMKKYKEMLKNPKAYVVRMTIWESFGWNKFTRKDDTRASFWYDVKRKKVVPSLLASVIKNEDMIEVPLAYKSEFDNNPEKAAKDLAGIPPTVTDPFISQLDRIEECVTRWISNHGEESPVGPNPSRWELADWFRGNGDPRRRHIHIDFAVSAEGDALGMAMGYIDHFVTREDEKKPYIVIDALFRLKAMPGTEIFFQDIRNMVYHLRNERRFRVVSVSMDGFQSTDTKQQLRKKRFHVEDMSADKSTLPYEDLREAINERRIEFPPYETYLRKGDGELVQVVVRELSQLTYNGKKVDHPDKGSKDVADALACVCSMLMGDRTYRRGVSSSSVSHGAADDDADHEWSATPAATGTDDISGNVLPFRRGLERDWSTTIPKTDPSGWGLQIPDRLRPR